MTPSAPESPPLLQLYGSLEATAGIGTWRYNFKAKHLVWSKGTYELLGLPETAIPTYDLFASFMHSADRIPVENLETYFKEVSAIDREFRLIDSRGVTRWISHKAEVFLDSEKKPIIAAGILTDISSRVNALNARDAAERRLRTVESVAAATWTTEPDGRKLPSQKWMDLTGQSLRECDGQGWLDAIHKADRDATRNAWLKAFKTKTRYAAKYRLKCRDGQLRWFVAQMVPVLDPHGDVEQWLGSLIDIDELERLPGSISEKSDFSALTGRVMTAARALLGWSVLDLAGKSAVSVSTIRRIEESAQIAVRKDVVMKLLSVLQEAGIEFRQDDEGWYVRARRR